MRPDDATPAWKRIALALASPKAFFYTAIWLLVLLVVGTIEQKYVGLYLAQQTYFSSWIWLFGFLPLPGGRLALTVMFLNLLAKLVVGSPIRWDRTGTLIAHGGGLLLLVGGFITAYFSTEGSVLLYEGDSAAHYDDYHELELAVVDATDPERDHALAFRGGYLEAGAVIEHASLPGVIRVREFYRNVALLRNQGPAPSDHKGLAARFSLRPKPLEKEFSMNRAGAVVELEGFGDQDGVYYLVQSMPVPQTLNLGPGEPRLLSLRQQRYPLPFAIELLEFKKEDHPGTRKARNFESVVNVIEDGVARRARIYMNNPLRIGPYTFYQASFVQEQNAEASVLAVVKNAGRVFPYLSSIVMCVGLLVHIGIRLPGLLRRSK